MSLYIPEAQSYIIYILTVYTPLYYILYSALLCSILWYILLHIATQLLREKRYIYVYIYRESTLYRVEYIIPTEYIE